MIKTGRLLPSLLFLWLRPPEIQAFDGQPLTSWAEWSEWSHCDRSCGSGLRSRVRQCLNGFPGEDGCQGANSENGHCMLAESCKTCAFSSWSFGEEGAPKTQLLKSTISSEKQEVVGNFSFCARISPTADELFGSLGVYSNPGTKEHVVIVSVRPERNTGGSKFEVLLDGEMNVYISEQAAETGWICLIRNGAKATLRYNEEALDVITNPSSGSSIKTGGELVSGQGFQGTLEDVFMVNFAVDYESLEESERCFEEGQLFAALRMEDLVTSLGDVNFNEQWAQWADWGVCSKTCDGGERFRIRKCIGGEPGEGGCSEGQFWQQEPCQTQQCPAGWREWSEWSKCSSSCGEGVKTRVRECKGSRCNDGDTTDTQPCTPTSIDQKGCFYSNWEFPDELSISNYVLLKKQLPNMAEATFCYWLKSGHDGVNGTIFSYAHGEQFTGNSFAVMGSTTPELGLKFFAFRKDERLIIDNDFTTAGEPQLQCFVLHRNSARIGMMDFYVDGKFKNSTVLQTGDLYMIEEGGELVVGQDQDCMLGCYQAEQAMTGNVLDFSIWDAALSETEMAAMSEAGFPSIARQPFVTLNKENSERYGRISYVAQWAEWNDWTKCSVTCQSGLRTRSRVCYGGRAGDYGCDGDEMETKGCYQGICEAIVEECSQSTWNLSPGGSASFKAFFNSDSYTFCAAISMDTSPTDNVLISAISSDDKLIIAEIDEQSVAEFFSHEVDTVTACVTSSQEHNTVEVYIDGELLSESSFRGGISRNDVFTFGSSSFGGQIKNFAVWDRFFAPAEIEAIFASSCHAGAILSARPDAQPKLKGQIRFQEGWSSWSPWSSCSVSCAGSGLQSRKRVCYAVDVESGHCFGPDVDTKPCGPLICPTWSNWSSWSSCSKSCGEGYIHRSRQCFHGTAGNPGCEGNSSELEPCEVDICPDPYNFPWECGTVTAKRGAPAYQRVVNGHTEQYGAVPYLCQLTSYGDHNCGTSVISPNWNIGAAHCVADYDSPAQFRIICGSQYRSQIDTYEQQRQVERYIKHPGYDSNSDLVDYDMMLFKVDHAWEFTDYVKPACLPKRNDYPSSGQLCKVSGWGSTQAKDATQFFFAQLELAEAVQSAYVPITEMGVCAAGYKSITRRQFCAGFVEGGRDACQGDSGGPLACPIGNRGVYQLTGIVSYGIGCGSASFPGVYTRVESLIDWILDHILDESTQGAATCQKDKIVDLETGGLNSPNFDGRSVYDFNQECSWIISVPNVKSSQKLVLDFTHFHLDADSNCDNDYVAIYGGPQLTEPIGRYCGRQAPPAIIFSSREKLKIVFKTDAESSAEKPTGFAAKFHRAPKKLDESGCGSAKTQMGIPELEKFLIANNKFKMCEFSIKPRIDKGVTSYPVIRLGPDTDPSCCEAVKISNHPKKFDERALVDSSSLCRGEPAVGLDGEIKMRVYNGQRDRRGRKCNLQVGFYSVTDPQVPYLNYEPATDAGQLAPRQEEDNLSQYTCYMDSITLPRWLGKSFPLDKNERLSSCIIEIRPKSAAVRNAASNRPPKSKNPKKGRGMLQDVFMISGQFGEEPEEYNYSDSEEVEEVDLESTSEKERARYEEQQRNRQARLSRRIAEREKIKMQRKAENLIRREEEKEARIEERLEMQAQERLNRFHQRRPPLLNRVRRGVKNKKAKKNSKKQNGKKGRIQPTIRPSRKNPPSRPQKGNPNGRRPSGGNGKSNISRTKQNNFRLCTATLLTPTTLITTAGCTGSDANNRLFAKIGMSNFDPRAPTDHVQTIMIRRCIAHPKYIRGEPNNDLQICFLAESVKPSKGIMIPCLTDTMLPLNDGDIVVTESRTNFNKGKTEGVPMRTHIPISGKYAQGKTNKNEPVLKAGYAFGDPLCMKEVGSPVFREDVNQRTLVGLVQGALTPENECPTRLFNIVDLRDHVDWITSTTKMGALAAEQAEKLAQKTHGARGTNDDRLIKMPRQSGDESRECGQEVISLWNLVDGGNCTNSMTISSPGYPGWYPANADCPVQIQAPEDTRVRVRIVEKFDIEASPNCQADKIHLKDETIDWNLCNGQLPDMPEGIVGTSSKMDVRFTTDGTVQRTGFKLQVDCVDLETADKIQNYRRFEEPEEEEKEDRKRPGKNTAQVIWVTGRDPKEKEQKRPPNQKAKNPKGRPQNQNRRNNNKNRPNGKTNDRKKPQRG